MQSNFSALYKFCKWYNTFLYKKNEINETEKRKLAYSKLKLKTIKEIPEVMDGDITIGCNQQNKNKV